MLTTSVNAQFVKHYKYYQNKKYNDVTETYENVLSLETETTIFFNIGDSGRDCKIVPINDEENAIYLYNVVADDEQVSEEYTTFTCYNVNGAQISGAYAGGWVTFSIGDVMLTYLTFKPKGFDSNKNI